MKLYNKNNVCHLIQWIFCPPLKLNQRKMVTTDFPLRSSLLAFSCPRENVNFTKGLETTIATFQTVTLCNWDFFHKLKKKSHEQRFKHINWSLATCCFLRGIWQPHLQAGLLQKQFLYNTILRLWLPTECPSEWVHIRSVQRGVQCWPGDNGWEL